MLQPVIGILTAIKVMEVMLEEKQSLGKLAEPVTIYPQLLKNVRVRDKKTAREDKDVMAAVDAVADKLGSEVVSLSVRAVQNRLSVSW